MPDGSENGQVELEIPTPSDAWPAVLPPEEPPAEKTVEQQIPDMEKARINRVLRHRAEIFVEISKDEKFQEVLAELDRKHGRMNKEFSSRLMAGEPADQRQIDYDRGFLAGLQYVRGVVTAAERTLKRLDEEAAREEQVSDPGNDEQRGEW